MKQNFLRRLGALALAFALALTLAPPAWAANPRQVTGLKVAGQDGNIVTSISIGLQEYYELYNKLTIYKVDGTTETAAASEEYELFTTDTSNIITLNSNNTITAHGVTGTVEVTIALKDGSASTKISVTVFDRNAQPERPRIEVGPEDIVTNQNGRRVILLGENESVNLTAAVYGEEIQFFHVRWSVVNTGVATVAADNFNNKVATLTGKSRGTTTLRVAVVDGSEERVSCEIEVNVGDFRVDVYREDTSSPTLITDSTRRITLEKGKTLPVSALVVGTYSDRNIRWDSSAPSIAKVDPGSNNGTATVTAVGTNYGTATITASGHGASFQFYITVPDPAGVQITGITVQPTELRMSVGEIQDLTAAVQPSSADQKVVWKSAGSDVAEVDGKGRVTAMKVGATTIQVWPEGDPTLIAECKVTVLPPLTDLRIQKKTANGQLTLNSNMNKAGQTQPLEAKAFPENASHGAVTWTSDDTSVVTVRTNTQYPSGLFAILTSVGPGEAKITVKCGDVEDSATVTIPGLVLKSGILTMTNGRLSMKEGETDQLTYEAFGQAKTLTNAVPNWISSDSSVVDVDRTTGAITARKSGTATITLELSSGNTYYEAKCEVTVVEDTSAIINAGTVNAGSSYTFDRLLSQLQSLCSSKVGGALSYINNLSVASTEQGILHDEHHSADDTGAGVGVQDRYYRNANTAQGQRPLSDLSFVPRTTFNGTAEVTFTGWNTTGKPFNGVIRFTVNGTGDVMYAANEGNPVNFLASDFNFYHPNLKSVSFTPPQESMGTLYYNYTSASQPGTKVTSGTQYKRTGTPGIDKITFVPASGYQGTVRIAYKGTDTSERSFTGTVTITVTRATENNRGPGDVSYSVRQNSWVSLRPSDFYSASRNVLGETLSYVRFTPPPSNEGTLFYNYRGFSDFDSMVDNTTNYYYSGGSPALSGVTFVPTTTTPAQVDIPYTGYTTLGNTFEGVVHITIGDAVEGNQPQQLPLHYTVFPGRTVNLSAGDFNTACRNATGSDLASIQFTRLPGTSQGTLRYTRGNSSTANTVTTGTRFYRTGTGSSANLIGNVYFQAGSSTGTVTIPFTGTSVSNTTFTDEVTIVITPPTASELTYSGTTASPIRLSASQVSSALSGAWNQSLSYITFTSLPSSTAGHLYVGYNGVGTGTQVNAGTRYYASGSPGIDQISFVPRGRYNGQVSVGYTAVSTGGQSVSGRILFNISSTGNSTYFSDMAYHTWAAPSVDYLYQNQVTNGVTATQYGPNQRINRCDFVLMLCRAFKFSGSNGYSFADVPTSSYFSQAVATAKQLGIVSGDGGNFRPYGQVTRQDAMVMTYNALQAAGWNVGYAPTSVLSQFSDSASVSSYAQTAVCALVQMGAVNGDNGRLLPHNSITRAEAAVILHFVMTM